MKHLIYDYESKDYFVVDDENLIPITKVANIPSSNVLPGDLHASWYMSGVLVKSSKVKESKYFFFYKDHNYKLSDRKIQDLSFNFNNYDISVEDAFISKDRAIKLVENAYTVDELIKLFNLKEY